MLAGTQSEKVGMAFCFSFPFVSSITACGPGAMWLLSPHKGQKIDSIFVRDLGLAKQHTVFSIYIYKEGKTTATRPAGFCELWFNQFPSYNFEPLRTPGHGRCFSMTKTHTRTHIQEPEKNSARRTKGAIWRSISNIHACIYWPKDPCALNATHLLVIKTFCSFAPV